jgi:hypothetical protein
MNANWIKEMQEHDPRHQNRMIYSHQWPDYFSNLAKSYTGSQVRLESDADLRLGSPGVVVTLTRIEYLPSRKHPQLTVATGQGECSCQINLVWSLEDVDDRVVAVEVIDPQDHKLNIYFEA